VGHIISRMHFLIGLLNHEIALPVVIFSHFNEDSYNLPTLSLKVGLPSVPARLYWAITKLRHQ